MDEETRKTIRLATGELFINIKILEDMAFIQGCAGNTFLADRLTTEAKRFRAVGTTIREAIGDPRAEPTEDEEEDDY